MQIRLTKHAIERARQRLRWSKTTLCRMVDRVFCFGIAPEETAGELHRYFVSKAGREATLARIYGEHLFVFARGAYAGSFSLLTVFQVPVRYRPTVRQVFREAVSAA